MTASVPRHPEAHTMAAFVDGTLPRDEVAAVAAHLRDCADCRTVVAETARFEREREQPKAARRVRPSMRWLAAAALIAAAAITVPLLRWNESRRAAPIARLIDAAPRGPRTLEARRSGFPWARLEAPARGAAPPDPADLKFTGAAGDVLERTANQRTPAARHATGVANLVIGRPADAVAALEQAANASNEARSWNDLAAARLALAAAGRPSHLPLALADADRALRLDPKLPEAHFNRALILERLGIRDQARKQWLRYLEVDSASEWSLEAREHLRALEGNAVRFDPKLLDSVPPDQLVRRFPQETRTWSEGPLLGQWADAEASKDLVRAAAILARLRAVGTALAGFKGDHLLADVVQVIDASTVDTRRMLVEAHRLYRDGRVDYSKRNLGAAETQLRRAGAMFRQAGSVMADVAEYFAANTAFDQRRAGDARKELARLQFSIDRKRHRALTAQIQWELAVIANADGDWGSGARQADASAAIFRSLGEETNAAFLDNVAALSFEMMGERDLSWTRRVRTYGVFAARGEQARQRAVLHGAAMTLAMVNEIPAAVAVIDLMIDDARGDAAQLAAALSNRARDAVRGGDLEAARGSIAEARRAVMRVNDPALRQIVGAQVDLADATTQTADNPRAAIASLDRTIAFLSGGGGLGFFLPDAYLQRARAFRVAGDLTAALADYSAALTRVEDQRTSIHDFDLRLSFLDTAANVIEELIDLQLSRGAAAEAFAVAEMSHMLLDPGPQRDAVPATVPSVPPRVGIIEYVVLPRAIALFCVTSEGLFATKIEIDRRELMSRIEAFAANIRRRAPVRQIRDDGGPLYRLLIAPVQQRLSGVDELVLIPDRQLHAVAFAALWDDAAKRYLIEQYTIRFAPAAPSSGAGEDRSLSPALVVADPPAARWPSLPASREEGARIAALYGATLLEGAAATRAAFVELAQRSALVHYAGHANSDAGESYGALLLAGSANDSGILGSSEIAALALSHRPLIVLAACGTFRGNTAHVAGMSSLARSFLIAGARGVVGTLWEVDDDVSAVLFSRFHQHLLAGALPARALRAAQLEMLHAADARLSDAMTWASIEYLSNR